MPDSGMFYLSKIFSDEWMVANAFLTEEELEEEAAAKSAR